MQQGSSQDLVGPQHTSEDISDAIDVSRSSETLWDTSNLVDSNEFVPSLPLSNTPEWDQWLVTSGNILAENHGPEKDMESGPFMSAYNALDNAWRTSSPPGSNTGRLSDLNVDNPRRSFSQINAYHTGNADLISSDMGFGHPAVGSMMTRTTAGIQDTNVFPSVDLYNEKPRRKIRRDKGIKRGPNRAKDVTLKSQDTISGGENSGKEATKRKRGLEETEDESEVPQKYAGHEGNNLENSMQNESGEKQGALRRRKWSRRNGNPNIQYRYNLRFNSQEEKEENVNGNGGILSRNSTSDGVSGLFQLLRTTIASKKIYPRRKKQSEQAETGASEGVTTAQEGDEPTSTADNNEATSSTEVAPKKTRASARRVKHNPRPHISEDTVRSTAPRGWNPYDNDFYSGDDNISDDYLENRGKSSAYKPPRMACRRCNKLKQPCDHGYPSCSLCAKNNLRCRYRDDLTGRQIRPGQLEEVEAAYYHSREEIRRLEDIVEEQKRLLEEANERVNAWQTTVRNMMELRNVLGGNLSSEGLQNNEKFAEE